jgi:hypothetical protein
MNSTSQRHGANNIHIAAIGLLEGYIKAFETAEVYN